MPQPKEATEPADWLVEVWQEVSELLDEELEGTADEIGRLAASGRSGKSVLRRSAVLALLAFMVHELDGAKEKTREWLASELVKVYQAGAVAGIGEAFVWDVAHGEAVQVLANRMWGDALAASKFVEADVRSTLTRAVKAASEATVRDGQTVRHAAKSAAKDVLSKGVGSVRYADGSSRKIGDYMEMAVRTRTAIAYNMGTLNGLRGVGAEYAIINDGSGCGFRSHNDPQMANGMIVSLALASAYPISHPNCVRSFAYVVADELGPGDIDEDDEDEEVEVEDAAVAFEEALRRQTASSQRGGRRTRSYRRR